MKVKKCFINCSEIPNSCGECELCFSKAIPHVYLMPRSSKYCLLDDDIDTNNYYRPSGCPLVAIDTDVPDIYDGKNQTVVAEVDLKL